MFGPISMNQGQCIAWAKSLIKTKSLHYRLTFATFTSVSSHLSTTPSTPPPVHHYFAFFLISFTVQHRTKFIRKIEKSLGSKINWKHPSNQSKESIRTNVSIFHILNCKLCKCQTRQNVRGKNVALVQLYIFFCYSVSVVKWPAIAPRKNTYVSKFFIICIWWQTSEKTTHVRWYLFSCAS